jgi:hypothetical protein
MLHQPTLFMRIHKTAGEALAKQIRDRLPAEAFVEQFEWQVRSLPLTTLRQFSFFQGHISPSALSTTFAPLRVFTILRAPMERLLSCFFYWKQGANSAKANSSRRSRHCHCLISAFGGPDPSTRHVECAGPIAGRWQFGGADHQRQNVFGPWLSSPGGRSLRALPRFAFVGVAESRGLTRGNACYWGWASRRHRNRST